MTVISVSPALVFYTGALIVLMTKGRLQSLVALLVPVVGTINLCLIPESHTVTLVIFDYELMPVRVDDLSLLFGYLFHIATFIGIIYALHVKETMQSCIALAYAGSALGAVFSGDLLTLFIFWELMAITSVFLIFARRTQRAYVAGIRYLVMQVLSGVLLLTGALLILVDTNSLRFEVLGLNGVGTWLVFLAFGIKSAFPFLHSWAVDAYPEATHTGTVFLSIFTTKVAVYALARGFPGTELLIYIGVVMTCFPIFYAVIENDLRRVLAYSMINQVGFMVCGVGVGTNLAINGAVAHAFSDVIFKGLLMMAMGAVLFRTGRINGSELGGLYRTMPKTTVLCVIGALSISAFPLFSGFVSKSMVMTAVLAEGYDWIWMALLFASAGVFHHAGIKIPYFAFFAHDSGLRPKEAPVNMLVAMTIAALICVCVGIFPDVLYRCLPFDVDYQPYDTTHIIAQLQLLFFSALAFIWLQLRGLYPPELRSTNLDIDWFYRRVGYRFYRSISDMSAAAYLNFCRYFACLCKKLVVILRPPPTDALGFGTARMAFILVVGLGCLLLVIFANG